jgi:hypothetical protein
MKCNCKNCQEVRMITALIVLAVEAQDEDVRQSAQLLLHAWAVLTEAGIDRLSADLPPAEAEALTLCTEWIESNPRLLVNVPREVAVSGYID